MAQKYSETFRRPLHKFDEKLFNSRILISVESHQLTTSSQNCAECKKTAGAKIVADRKT